jgi:hypothetical protein
MGFYIPEDDILHSHRRENLKSYSTVQWLEEPKESQEVTSAAQYSQLYAFTRSQPRDQLGVSGIPRLVLALDN